MANELTFGSKVKFTLDTDFSTPDDDNDAATKGYVDSLCPYAVGDWYFTVSTTAPGTRWAGTTWAEVEGIFPVGYKSGDTDFGTLGATGGAKTKNLQHTHPISPSTKTYTAGGLSVQSSPVATGNGGSTTQDILPPFKVVHIYERTA